MQVVRIYVAAKAINLSATELFPKESHPQVQPSPSSAISTCSSLKLRQTSLYCILGLCFYWYLSVIVCERATTSSVCVSIRDPARIELPLHDRYPHFNHNNQRTSADPGYGVIVILLGYWWSEKLGVYHALVVSCQGRVRLNQERGWSDPEGFYKISESPNGARPTTYNMDPPTRSFKRRAVSAQTIGTNLSGERHPLPSSNSPGSNPKYGQLSLDKHPRPRGQTVSVGWVEGDSTSSRRTSSLQFEVAECVETKTITTTTTTKRSYPPLLIRQRLDELDVKEYPLAMQPPPAELLNFTYEVDEPATSQHEDSNPKLVSNIPFLTKHCAACN